MSRVTQAQALAVLRDVIERDEGRVDAEVRAWVAAALPALRIATAWDTGMRCDAADGEALADIYTQGGFWFGRMRSGDRRLWLAPSPMCATAAAAKAWCDTRLLEEGWTLAPEATP